jgi:hypothetical protein
MLKKYFTFFLIALLCADVLYSFVQHTQVQLDGDMSSIVLPSWNYKQVLEDPFGLSVILKNDVYGAPNRFFVHWSMSHYFHEVPKLLQAFVSPIDSIYVAAALAKILIQVALIYLLALYVSREKNIFRYDWLLAAVLIVPLFQTSGFNGLMGIIDKSITYTFFYALSMVLLLIYLYPFFTGQMSHHTFNRASVVRTLFLLPLAVVLTFNGPLVPAVVMLVCAMTLVYLFSGYYEQAQDFSGIEKIKQAMASLPRPLLFHFMVIGLLSMYSLYVGTHNIENDGAIPVLERYARIPQGLFEMFTQKIGLPIVLIVLAINLWLIKKVQIEDAAIRRMMFWFKALALFSVVYLLILPLGGYRAYRPDIVRRDTIMPILLCLFYMYGYSTYYLLQQGMFKGKKIYVGLIVVALFIFTISDKPIAADNACEKQALHTLAASPQDTVLLSSDCMIMSWHKVEQPLNSINNTAMLKHWGVLSSDKLYYQK